MTTPERSRIMRAIRSRGNRSTELAFLCVIKAAGATGWRRHTKLPGTPDFAFRLQRLAIFIDGCWWHGCPRCYRAPKTNRKFWKAKVAGNRARDIRVARELLGRGWKVWRVWEHELKDIINRALLAGELRRMLRAR